MQLHQSLQQIQPNFEVHLRQGWWPRFQVCQVRIVYPQVHWKTEQQGQEILVCVLYQPSHGSPFYSQEGVGRELLRNQKYIRVLQSDKLRVHHNFGGVMPSDWNQRVEGRSDVSFVADARGTLSQLIKIAVFWVQTFAGQLKPQNKEVRVHRSATLEN